MRSLFYLSLFLIFFSGTVAEQKKDSFHFLYEAPTTSIEVNDTMMIRKVYIDEYDNPVSSTPTNRLVQTQSVYLEQSYVKKFSNAIKKTGFKKLDPEYGVSPNERYYSYRISVKLGCYKYEVVYRSNPSGPVAPNAFTDVEKLVARLIKENIGL